MCDLLGQGRGGIVKRGIVNGTSCAIKYYSNNFKSSYRIQEIKILNNIDHPNCLKIVSFDEGNIPQWVATELMLPRNLHEFLKDPFSEKMAAYILRKILHAVKHLHCKGFVHRDIKPQNILFHPLNFEPILADFGCSNSIEQFYVQIGTKGFMAPEVVTGKKVAQIGKCDVFSLGILSFILIFGFEPFSTNYSGYWFTLIKLNKWTDFWRDRTVSDEFKEFFEKMINFNNEDRYSLDEAFENQWLKQGEELDLEDYYSEMEHRYEKLTQLM